MTVERSLIVSGTFNCYFYAISVVCLIFMNNKFVFFNSSYSLVPEILNVINFGILKCRESSLFFAQKNLLHFLLTKQNLPKFNQICGFHGENKQQKGE
jgi:hypothetical protein